MAVKRLSQYVIPHKDIPLNEEGDFFQVRGISGADIIRLSGDFAPAMMMLYGKVMETAKGDEKLEPQAVIALLKDALREAPDLVFHAIALANDDPDGYDVVTKLPLTVQLEAIEQIMLLSIRSDAELKKFQEVTLRLIQKATGMFSMLNPATAFNGGSGKSGRG